MILLHILTFSKCIETIVFNLITCCIDFTAFSKNIKFKVLVIYNEKIVTYQYPDFTYGQYVYVMKNKPSYK